MSDNINIWGIHGSVYVFFFLSLVVFLGLSANFYLKPETCLEKL